MSLRLSRTGEGARPYMSGGSRHIGRNFGETGILARPHSSQPRNSLSRNSKICASADEDFFQATNVLDCAQCIAGRISRWEAAKIENWIGDELSGAVESDIAATIAFVNLYAALGEEFG